MRQDLIRTGIYFVGNECIGRNLIRCKKKQQCKTLHNKDKRRTLEHCMLGIGEFRPVFTKTHSVIFGCRPQTDNLYDSSQKNGEKAFPCSANGPVEIAICQRQIRSKGDFYCPFY
jgi:hypothetical protein